MEPSGLQKRFGIAVLNWRNRLHISQDDLAARTGFQRSYISDVERGTRNVTLANVEKIINALGISTWNFFSELAERPGTEPLTTDELVDILLVEDQPRDAELTLEALKDGHITNRIYVARDGAEALNFLFCSGSFAHRRPGDLPQIILLDLHLPKIDGLEVLRRIKADARTRDIPVIVLTGSQESGDIMSSKSLGAETYIVKPVDLQNFSAATLKLSLQWTLLKPRTARA